MLTPPRTRHRRPVLPFIVLALIGLPFLAATIFVGGRQALFVFRAHRATAIFQDAVAHSGGRSGGTFLYPRLKFTTSDGRTVTFTSKNGSTGQPFSDGQAVAVLYEPAEPTNAVIDSFWSLWLPTLFLSVFVLGFLGLPYLIWRLSRRVPCAYS